MRKLYLFDFDGTLTTRDTMFLFLRFYNPGKFYWQFLRHSTLFALVKLKLANAEKVKESFISSILKGQEKASLDKISVEFMQKYWDVLMRPEALKFIKNNMQKSTEGYLVTASLDIWAAPFAQRLGLNLISTQAEFINGRFTGKFSTPNCNGEEKVSRIKAFLQGKKYDKVIAFGDTDGDRAMLNFSDESFFKYFH